MRIQKRGVILVVLSIFFLFLIQYSAQAENSGCYLYPKASEDFYCLNNVLESEAKTDCDSHPGCKLGDYFYPGKDCSQYEPCKSVKCTIDCQTHALGKCQDLGGAEIPEADLNSWCNPGCCKIEKISFCQSNLLRYDCELKATQKGVAVTEVFFKPGLTKEKCSKEVCQVEVKKANFTGYILDKESKPVFGALIILEAMTKIEYSTDSTGQFFFELNPGIYKIQISKDDYKSISQTLDLKAGELKEVNFTLIQAVGEIIVKGIVLDKENNPLPEAAVSWKGPVTGSVSVDQTGSYQTPLLPAGEYTFTASAFGYKKEEKPKILDPTVPEVSLEFSLEKAVPQTIKGQTYLDKDNDFELGLDIDQPIYDVKLYLDGIFKGYSQYPDGSFEIPISLISGEEETHQISAVYQDYSQEPITFTIAPPGQIKTQNLLLSALVGECAEPGTEQNVEQLNAVPVPGKEEIQLSWNKPCPEVIGYKIVRMKGGAVDETFNDISLLDNSYTDTKAKWGEEYTYQIFAVYDHGQQKEPTVSESVNTGNKFCENKYHPETDAWDHFCIVGDKASRKIVWTCDNKNQLLISTDCALEYDQIAGADYYCAKISETEAACKNGGICSNPLLNLFGLYSSKETCYGTINPLLTENFCYYDYALKTSAKTIVDQCLSCSQIENCFDYQSQDACEFNNCFGSECQWVSGASNLLMIDYSLVLPGLVTPETGAGYCIEKDYDSDDKCSLCSPGATLFENYFCTADVCSGLGRCFSVPELVECRACGETPTEKANCHRYGTESECTEKKNGIQKTLYGQISLSEDQCEWGRCSWQGAPNGAGSCVKDSDADGQEDCSSFENIALNKACMVDISPPKTKIDPEGVNTISYAKPNLTFVGNDNLDQFPGQNNYLGSLGYCLESPDPTIPISCTNDQFIEEKYPGKSKEELLAINLINSPFLQNKQLNGETSRLKYYSKDRYFNQENLQVSFVFIDNVIPEFEIKSLNQTIGDLTTLTVWLEKVQEKMECQFKLDQIVPKGETKVQTIARDVLEKKAVFEGLNGVAFNLNVTCKDDAGNTNSQPESYIFNLDQNIELIYPQAGQVINQLSIPFKIKTAVGSTCGLYLSATNEKLADFISNEEGKEHQTEPISGFYEKDYAGDYKPVCKEFFADKIHEAVFDFKVDFTAPETQITLTEGKREEKPMALGLEEWEFYFIKSVKAGFECQAEGFGCDKTYYCLSPIDGSGCDYPKAPGYIEYSQPFEVANSTKICYYSTDLGKNPVYGPACGKIIIDGYGIRLESPEPHYYLKEVWGISNLPIFDWKFSTRVPTTECRFDYNSGFDYQAMPGHKVRKPKEGESVSVYLFENFPESVLSEYPDDGGVKTVYVKCKNTEDEIGPEQKFNLEYDPSAPEIIKAYAQPDKVLEGVTTDLFTETDDKTLCKYSDNSESQGSSEYLTMEYSFPGTDEKILDLVHQDTYQINFLSPDGKKDYLFNAQCKNGAGNLSEVKTIGFSVDYAEKGYLVEGTLLPEGYISFKTATISVETSKSAYCQYDLGDGQADRPFEEGQGTKSHSAVLGNLTEKEYLIPVKCTFGDHSASGQIKFTVDWTAPKINETNDGNKTCGSEIIKLFVYTNEDKLAKYESELYDLGEQISGVSGQVASQSAKINATKTNISSKVPATGPAQKVLIKTEIVDAVQPLEISTSLLNESHKYSFRIRAQDAAGNWGNFAESDGVLVTAKNYSSCTEDRSAPEIVFKINDSSCTKNLVEMFCNDAAQCSVFKYLQQPDSKNCQNFGLKNNNSISYSGQKLEFFKPGWICYFAADAMGNNLTGSKEIIFLDKDGDGIRDTDACDQCKNTITGAKVDDDGCDSDNPSDNENKTDSDGDKLPDYWEKLHGQDGCELNYLIKDSDNNGVPDNEEDYDDDGMNNYEEYLGYSDPCKRGPLPAPEKECSSDTDCKKNEICKNKKCVPKPIPPPPPPLPTEETNILPWIFLIIGLLMFLGGTGYLIYYYLYSPAGKAGTAGKGGAGLAGILRPTEISGQPGPVLEKWKSKILELRKAKEEKFRKKRREEIFGEFGPGSKTIPHLENVIQKKAPALDKINEVVQKYAEHKDEILPGLKKEEKSVFSKLDNLARQTRGGKNLEKIDPNQAKDIFNQLKEISRKRKQ